ncbi:MAG: TraR/DksA family transcriptional regulator [Deltaproteobacteria bacterium]|nr:TraR/DksA family transcriptional regulator [Deltaproteobacteria bacterium]
MPNSKNQKQQSAKQRKKPSEKQKGNTGNQKKSDRRVKGSAVKKTVKLHPKDKEPFKKQRLTAAKPTITTGISRPKGKEPFEKQITKILFKAKEELLMDVSQKVKEETNTSKFEIGDIYDIASTERDRELSLILGDRDREKLANIEDAFERLKDGTYGICEECGEPIGEERLKVLPFTKVCVECKSKNEREHGCRRKYEEETGFGIIEKTEVEEEF